MTARRTQDRKLSIYCVIALIFCSCALHGISATIIDEGTTAVKDRALKKKCQDSQDRFVVNGEKGKRGCEWVGREERAISKRCKFDVVRTNCPKTCGLCEDGQSRGKGKGANPSPVPSTSIDPSMLPSSAPSSSQEPSSVPSTNPSISPQPSSEPSALPSNSKEPSFIPSTAPTTCVDEPNWTLPSTPYSTLPDYFIGMSCSQLEGISSPEIHEQFCDTISLLDTGVEKCAREACCFCGGGKQTEVPCSDFGEWTLNGILTCEDIAKSDNSDALCEAVKDYDYKGITGEEACCVCSGGEKYSTNPNTQARETQEKKEHEEHRNLLHREKPVQFRDWTFREGLGESPGIRNLEYLGVGYDALRGNPRGSRFSEIDPGMTSTRALCKKIVHSNLSLTLVIHNNKRIPLSDFQTFARPVKAYS